MRRKMLLCLFALLAAGAVKDACAQRGAARGGFARGGGGYGFSRARAVAPRGFGYGYMPYYDSGADYGEPLQPAVYVQPQPVFVEPPAPPVPKPVGHPVVTEYKWPAESAATASKSSDAELQTFAIVLKDGSTLAAVSIFASEDGVHYVDPDERHVRISMSEIDRAATLKVNRARNLNPYLPAAE